MRSRVPAVALLACLALAVPALPAGSGAPRPAPAEESPSIVLILTDDQRFDTLWAMPRVQRGLAARGMTFTEGFVVNPVCCPSRASILTGRYSHSTGVWTNRPPHGGFPAFRDGSTVATWLHERGYTTGFVGKYLNWYGGPAQRGYVPPGWDRWVALALNNVDYYDYRLTIDGRIHRLGRDNEDYATDTLASHAVSFIRETSGPLFLHFSPPAPHEPATPARRHRDDFSRLAPYSSPSTAEEDVSDKPAWAQRPVLSPEQWEVVEEFRRNQFRSLLAVDEAVGRILDALRDTGRLSSTMIVFASDNGWLLGEHGLRGKQYPYEESIRVPLLVRYDPVTAPGSLDDHLVLNIDLAPTFAEVAGAAAPAMDGRSLLPLLAGEDPPWRSSFLVEHVHADRPIPTYIALRTERAVYIEYSSGARELYDLDIDPHQLQNLAHEPAEASRVSRLRAMLYGRARPLPPGFPERWAES